MGPLARILVDFHACINMLNAYHRVKISAFRLCLCDRPWVLGMCASVCGSCEILDMFVLSVSLCSADLWVSLSTDKGVSELVCDICLEWVRCDSAPVKQVAMLEHSEG